MTGSSYVVLLPVKPPARGKSRLEVDPARRRDAGRRVRPRHGPRLPRGGARRAPCWPSPTTHASPTTCARPGARRSPTESPATSTSRSARLRPRPRDAGPTPYPVAVCADLPALLPGDLDAALPTPRTRRRPVERSRLRGRPRRCRHHALHRRRTTRSRRTSAAARGRRTSTPGRGRSPCRLDTAAPRRRRPGGARGGRDARRRCAHPAGAARPDPGHDEGGRPLGRPPSRLVRPSWRSSSPEPSWPWSSWPAPSSQAPSWPGPSSRSSSWRAPSSRPRGPSSPAPSSQEPSWPAPSWRWSSSPALPSSRRGGLLGRCGLLRGRSLLGRSRGLLGRGGTGGQRQLRQLLGAGDDVLQVRAGGELRHRGLLRLDPRAGLGVAHPAGLADALLERPEARDRDLLALGHLAGDRVQDGLQRVLGLLAVPLVTRRQRVDELRLVHGFPSQRRRDRADARRLVVNAMYSQREPQSPRAVSRKVFSGESGSTEPVSASSDGVRAGLQQASRSGQQAANPLVLLGFRACAAR